jgi:serine/threonine protein kinase
VHRRVITSDYGKTLYKASSRAAILATLEGGISGYESLYTQAGILHRDISIDNILMNEEAKNPSWRSFLIDLDLAIKERLQGPSGAQGKTGTRGFMAIGVLLGEEHSAWHDFESFFWVLFWICIHYNGPNKKGDVIEEFDEWHFVDTEELAINKKGVVVDEEDFLAIAGDHFSLYYQPLVPWVNRLRKVVFPDGRRRKGKDENLPSQMREVLQEARKDPTVLAK